MHSENAVAYGQSSSLPQIGLSPFVINWRHMQTPFDVGHRKQMHGAAATAWHSSTVLKSSQDTHKHDVPI